MPEIQPRTIPLKSLVLGALDDFSHIKEAQLLLKIGLEQADSPTAEACEKLALVVEAYFCMSETWIEEVELGLERIRTVLG